MSRKQIHQEITVIRIFFLHVKLNESWLNKYIYIYIYFCPQVLTVLFNEMLSKTDT